MENENNTQNDYNNENKTNGGNGVDITPVKSSPAVLTKPGITGSIQPADSGTGEKNNAAKESVAQRERAQNESGRTTVMSVKDNRQTDNKLVKKKNKKRVFVYDEEDENKGNGIILTLVKTFVYIALVILAAIFIAYQIIVVANDVFAFEKEELETVVYLRENITSEEIIKILDENGIIEYPYIFKLYLKLRKDDGVFLNENVIVRSNMSYDEIISTLKYKPVIRQEIRLRFLEGSTTDQIINLLVEKGIGNRDKYIDVINNYDFDVDFLPDREKVSPDRKYYLEGYMYPDTYDFYTTESEESVIYKFLLNFGEKTKKHYEKYYAPQMEKLGMSLDDFIILSSIICMEVRRPDDYSLVSSVFHNRLNNKSRFPKLESDATIQYFLDERTPDLTLENLQTDNPYNTYVYEGLTPGAICNPGIEAIDGAFFPAKTNYFYFVSNNAGKIYYGKDNAEHERNKTQVKIDNEEMAKDNYQEDDKYDDDD